MKLFILIWWQASICFSFRDESSLKKKCPTLSFLLLLTPPNFNLLNQGFHPSQLLKISPNLCKYIFYWSSAYKTLPFFTRVNHSYLTPRYVTISNWDELNCFKRILKMGSSFMERVLNWRKDQSWKTSLCIPKITTWEFVQCIFWDVYWSGKGGKESFWWNWSELIDSKMFMGWCKSMRRVLSGWSEVMTLLSDTLTE